MARLTCAEFSKHVLKTELWPKQQQILNESASTETGAEAEAKASAAGTQAEDCAPTSAAGGGRTGTYTKKDEQTDPTATRRPPQTVQGSFLLTVRWWAKTKGKHPYSCWRGVY